MHRVRFAPSPTGFLHIGSARTYIFNWLFARHNCRDHDPAAGRYRCGAQYRCERRLHLRRAALARSAVGRVPQAIGPAGAAPRDCAGHFRKRPGLPRLHAGSRRRFGEKRRAGDLALQPRDAGHLARGERPPRRRGRARSRCASACRANWRAPSASPTRFTASRRRPTPTWKTSRCCAATGCRPITWPVARTTPTCALPTSFAARSTSLTRSSTS